MLVYGDPKFTARLGALFEALRCRIHSADCSNLEDLRALLIFAGQIEQGVSDRDKRNRRDAQLLAEAVDLTDSLARLFCRRFISEEELEEKNILVDAIETVARAVENSPHLAPNVVSVKVPEGYAFYALFPEQYCTTAQDWARQHATETEVLVVGVRSIGTSLSAVVKESLCQMGRNASRFTVRPRGHPLHRQLILESIPKVQATPVLIVDEGPGISGSSMAAVAEAFAADGCSNISFLPGHGNEPASASAPVKQIWQRVPRFVTPIEKVNWTGGPLERSLLAQTQALIGLKCERIRNLSGGAWQQYIPGYKIEWPTSPPQFERMKFMCCEQWTLGGLEIRGIAWSGGRGGCLCGNSRAAVATREC